MPSRFLRALFVCAAIAGLLIHRADTVRAISSGVVISQVYGAGGNTGALLRNDYIELFNLGASSVSLAGMSVQYAATGGTSWSVTALPAVTLAPGQGFLVQESGGANGAALPTPDATGTLSMAAGAGKVALAATTTALTGSCPGGLVDFVGYGTGTNCFEGSGPTGTISATSAALRSRARLHRHRRQQQRLRDRHAGAAEHGEPACAVRRRRHRAQRQQHHARRRRDQRRRQLDHRHQFQRERDRSASAFSLQCPAGSPRTFTQSASPATTFTLTPARRCRPARRAP